MYFDYMINWIYRVMQLPVPIVTSPNVYGLVTIFDIFMFTVYIAVFVILIRYIITDNLSFKVGSLEDISYNPDIYIPKKILKNISDNMTYRKMADDYIAKRKFEIKNRPKEKSSNKRYLDTRLIKKKSIAGTILSKKKGTVWFDVNNN